MNTIVIEWQRLLDAQEQTCERCGSTELEVAKAVEELNQRLNQLGIDVSLVKKSIDPVSFKKDVSQSNKVVIAGRTLEEWLGADTGQSECCGPCGDSECRTVEYAGKTHETIPADLVVKAGLVAASEVFHVKVPEVDQRKPILKILSKKC